jgi:hypothetical protein
MTKKILAAAIIGLAGATGAASVNAGTISFTDTIATQSTGWGPTSLTVNQFDSSLGSLTAVEIIFSGNVEGTAKTESLDADISTVTANLSADLTLDLTSLTTSDIILLGVGDSSVHNYTAFDGATDFAGTSGASAALSGTDSDSLTTTAAADLALFTGLGTISFDAGAVGASSATGAGNLITQFITNAGAGIEVIYTYDTGTTVPAPAPLALMAFGLLGLAGVVRSKKSA